MWFDEAARHFGYTPAYLREMIAEGRFPAARGEGERQYYTGDDVAAITLLLGRWKPAERSRKSPDKSERSRKNEDEPES